MRPLRRRLVFAHLALFALAMQFIASFGHMHAHLAHTPPLASRTFFIPSSGGCLPGLPDHLDCTVCVAINLLGASALPQAVSALTLLQRFAETLSEGGAVRVPPDAVTASFRARGPPNPDLT